MTDMIIRSRVLFLVLIFFCIPDGIDSEFQCLTITILDEVHVRNFTCNAELGLTEIYVYEDCPVDTLVLKIEDAGAVLDDCLGSVYLDESASGSYGFTSKADRDADQVYAHLQCDNLVTVNGDEYGISHIFIDIDEFPPMPYNISLSQAIDVDENTEDLIYKFGYTDQDIGEISTIDFDFVDDGDGTFELRTLELKEEVQFFGIYLLDSKSLDFESRSSYTLNIVFTTNDQRDGSSNSTQVFYLSVNDVGDTQPIFTVPCPFQEIDEESPSQTFICQVQARDGDFVVNNNIRYSLSSVIPAYGVDFFTVDETSGEIKTTDTIINREELEDSSFALEIQATEILDDGSEAPLPNNITQITNVYINDVNDEIPTFNQTSYEAYMDEFNKQSPTSKKTLANLTISIRDPDQGDAGQYFITSDNPEVVSLNPTSGSGTTDVSVTILFDEDFDFEKHEDEIPIQIFIIATEKKNSSHESETELLIHLIDVNDEVPVFENNSYSAYTDENTPSGSNITEVLAIDMDSSTEFNEVVYLLKGDQECTNNLQIDNSSGLLTVSDTATLDFESTPTISCTLSATDANDINRDSLQSENIPFTLFLNDLNDEFPEFENFEEELDVNESTTANSTIFVIEVIDLDADSLITVQLSYQDQPGEEIENWFILEEDSSSANNHYIGNLKVQNKVDRETATFVTLSFKARDNNAEDQQSVTEIMTINLLDVNDEAPTFDEDYSAINYYENTIEDEIIAIIKASDYDENDQIFFSISNNTWLEIKDENFGNISIKNEIDREEIESFKATVYLNDLVGHQNSTEIVFTVLDRNDEKPEFTNDSLCNNGTSISENEDDGVVLTTVSASDADEGVHGEVIYSIENYQLVVADPSNQYPPFSIDPDTGTIVVDQTSYKNLDREKYSEWTLYIQAIDSCQVLEEDCQRQKQLCTIQVEVLDENDEAPGLFGLSTPGVDIIYTDEDLLQNEEITPDVEISAVDLDEEGSPNSQITYQTKELYFKLESEDFTKIDQLFEAESNNRGEYYFCTLKALQNLTQLRGDYIITIQANDGGDLPQESFHNFSLIVSDTNDNAPQVYFSSCLIDSNQVIEILENDAPLNEVLPCIPEGSDSANFFISDADEPDSQNAEVNFFISGKVCTDGGNDNQLNNFAPFDYMENNTFGIQLESPLNREECSSYNLILTAYDSGKPSSMSTDFFLSVKVIDQNEFEPIFCEEDSCQANMYVTENSDALLQFTEASDSDNLNGNNTFVQNDNIYYYIIDYDEDAFTIPDSSVNMIQPYNNNTIDREKKDYYQITILASNSKNLQNFNPSDSDSLLYVEVTVVDENDEVPYYDDTIYGSYLFTGSEGDPVVNYIQFFDGDLNDSLSYYIGDDISWIPENNIKDPFVIQEIEGDDRGARILLSTDPGKTSGQCSFTLYCTDENPDHEAAEATVEVFVITDNYIVLFYFNNSQAIVAANSDNVEDILSDAFGYICKVDDIYDDTDDNNVVIEGQSVVSAHFINSSDLQENQKSSVSSKTNFLSPITLDQNLHSTRSNKRTLQSIRNLKILKQNKAGTVTYELVLGEDIEALGNSGEVVNELVQNFAAIGLSITHIGDAAISGNLNAYEDQIIALKISIGAVCVVLGLLIILLVLGYWHKTTKLQRQLKALSIKTYRPNEMSIIGVDMVHAPGTNLYSGKNANPILNMNDSAQTKKISDDNDSIGSGDSVLIGVEDNLEFVNHKASTFVHPESSTDFEDQYKVPADSITSNQLPPIYEDLFHEKIIPELEEEKDATNSETSLNDFTFTLQRNQSLTSEETEYGSNIEQNSNFVLQAKF